MKAENLALVIMIAMAPGIAFLNYKWDKHVCYSQYQSYNPSYGWAQGCMVNYKGEHVPAKNIRVI